MLSVLTHGGLYFCAERRPMTNAITLFGAGFDAQTSARPGTRFAPDAIRLVSEDLESYSPYLDADLEDIALCDLGNLEFSLDAGIIGRSIYQTVRGIMRDDGRPLMLGGDHSLTPHAVKALYDTYPNLLLLQLDAHADLRDDFNDSKHSHASAMRRCLDFLPSEQLLQYGIRSGTREEFREMRCANRLVCCVSTLEERLKAHPHRPIYVSIDVDVFDPALIPGTGTPEAGGISWSEFEAILGVLRGRRIAGADVMELAPHYDASGNSTLHVAKLVRELALTMA